MNIVRHGDLNNRNGEITRTQNQTVFVNDTRIATKGDIVTYRNMPTTRTGNGSRSVFINGVSVNRVRDIDEDGSLRVQGDMKVQVG